MNAWLACVLAYYVWDYFITLTIDPKKLDNTDFNLVSEKLNIWTNNLKKRYAPDLKYILVPELHKDKTKWHFHGLFADIGQMPLAFSGKTCIGKFVYTSNSLPYAVGRDKETFVSSHV